MDAVTLESITEASKRLTGFVTATPLEHNRFLSDRYGANIFLKREDLQPIGSYKLRGAFNLMSGLSEEDKSRGTATASAGNHSQAVAYVADQMGIEATIFMPRTTPTQKVQNTERFGNGKVRIILEGDDFDEAYKAALAHAEKENKVFVHPFNDPLVISGQGTVGKEVLEQFEGNINYLLVPIGGGGLISGIGTYFFHTSPQTELIGVEPTEAAAMYHSLQAGQLVTLDDFSHFVDGAAVRRVGNITFDITQKLGYKMVLVPEGEVCTTVIELYNKSRIVAELAGALPVAALSYLQNEIKGKNVVCILSGGNNDFDRLSEIRERSLIHEGLKHYFIIEFPQRPGALKQFLEQALGPTDDITRFEYTKKTAAEFGPALVGIQLRRREDYEPLVSRFRKVGFKFEELNNNSTFLRYFI